MVTVECSFIGGVILGAAYLYNFRAHCHDADKCSAMLDLCRTGACILAFEVFCVLTCARQTSLRILGAICAFFSIMVSASPLVAIEDVFRTQSVASMQTDMVIVCFCGSCAWATVGFLMHDMCIVLPNCFGIVIGGIQVHLILRFSEESLWKSQAGDTWPLLKRPSCGDGIGNQRPSSASGYEASVYKRIKIFVLLSVAHARFVAENYAAFAMSTVLEVCTWMLETCAKRKGGWPSCGLGSGCRGKEFVGEADEGECLGRL